MISPHKFVSSPVKSLLYVIFFSAIAPDLLFCILRPQGTLILRNHSDVSSPSSAFSPPHSRPRHPSSPAPTPSTFPPDVLAPLAIALTIARVGSRTLCARCRLGIARARMDWRCQLRSARAGRRWSGVWSRVRGAGFLRRGISIICKDGGHG